MSGSHKNTITCRVVANVEDFVGVLLTHLYGLLEERSKTLSGGAGVHAVLCCVWLCLAHDALQSAELTCAFCKGPSHKNICADQ
jgi:hypothetical protein